MTLRQELEQYLRTYTFGKTAGAYEDTWVKYPIIKNFGVWIPNIEARKQALRIHDINHILTGYPPGK